MKMALTETSPLLVAVLRATNGLRNAKGEEILRPLTPPCSRCIEPKETFYINNS